MTDLHGSYDEEDRLPWLEAVDEEDEPSGPSFGKLIGALILGLVVLGAAVGGYFRYAGQQGGAGEGALIVAPAGDYKTRPDDPGGMEVEGEGDVTFAASEGADPRGRIDFDAVQEAPVTKARPKPKAPQPKQATTADDPPATIQLGAFSTQASADSAWAALSGRFGYLDPLAHSVVPVESGGRTLYRLRASGAAAADICGRLRVAGETCVDVD